MQPAISEAKLELRPTVGHAVRAQPIIGASPSTSLREQTHTADASGGVPMIRPATSDAVPAGGNATPHEPHQTDGAPASPSDTASSREAEAAAAKPAETDSSEAAKTDLATTGSTIMQDRPVEKGLEAKADDVKLDPPKPEAPQSGEKPADKTGDAAKAATAVSPTVSDAKKDQGRLSDAANAAAGRSDLAASTAPKRSGQIAVFISRKDSKLYVRQNFAPLFEAPVTIAASDRPLGTHVFTAEIDKNDANIVHWSVVSLPARHAERRDEDALTSRRRKSATVAVVVPKPSPVPDSPGEALDRITIPTDAMARITDALSTGASIIVSDQGISAGETGEGTDFIVSLR